MRNKKTQVGRSMIENFFTKFVNFATVLVVKCKNLRKICRVELLDANRHSLHRGNVLASESKKQSYFNSNRRVNNTQTGRSMIEMLGVLSIMSIITVLAVQGYNMGIKSVSVNAAKSNILSIASKVKDFYSADGDYSQIKNDTELYKMKITGIIDSTDPTTMLPLDGYPDSNVFLEKPSSDTSVFNISIQFTSDADCQQLQSAAPSLAPLNDPICDASTHKITFTFN